jgi:hypothetical protein
MNPQRMSEASSGKRSTTKETKSTKKSHNEALALG